MSRNPYGTDPLMPDAARHPVRELGVPRRGEDAPVLLGRGLGLLIPLSLRLTAPPLHLPPLHLPPILLLSHLPVIQKTDKRHRQAKDEEELDIRLIVRLVAAAVADGVVKDVIVEPFIVVEYVVLDEVCYPLG